MQVFLPPIYGEQQLFFIDISCIRCTLLHERFKWFAGMRLEPIQRWSPKTEETAMINRLSDGKKFLMIEEIQIDNSENQINIILNWDEELKSLFNKHK